MASKSEDRVGKQNRLAHFCYLALTSLQIAVGMRILYAKEPHTWNDWGEWVSLWHELSYIAITATVISVCVTELGGYIVVLATELKRYFDRKWAERDEKFRQGGREEAFTQVAEWNARRLEAEARGEPFDEPPPGVENQATRPN